MAFRASQIPIIGGFFDNSGDNILNEMQQNAALYQGIQAPNFKNYTPEQYEQAGLYNPTLAQYQTIQQDPELRSQQMSNLARMANLADTGLSDVDQMKFQQARDIGNEISRGGTEAALQNAEARGQAGTGLEFGMRELASQNAANRAQQAALDQAGNSAQMRALYTQAFGNALQGQSNQEFNQNAANADIINRFNQANTQTQNQGQLYNLGQQQAVANANVTNSNQAQQYNNQLQQQYYQDQLSKANGEAGANQGVANAYAAEGAADASNRNSLLQTGILGAALL